MCWDMNTQHHVGLFLYPCMVEQAVPALHAALEGGGGRLAPARPGH